MELKIDKTGKNFLIRKYREGDEYEINKMFNEVFHENRGINHWYWKYRHNPYGSYFISLAVSPEGIPAAHFAAYPLKLFFYNSGRNEPIESTIFHAGDKMTRKEFRAVGLGKNALLTRIFIHFKETFTPDTLFTYGFMTHHSLKFGLLFLNYVVIEPVPYRKLECVRLSGLKVNLLKKIINTIKVESICEIDESWTDFFNRTTPHYKCLIKKDASYLRWRYLQRPDRKYLIVAVKKRGKLAGWSIFFRESNKIIWGDALFEMDLECVKSVLVYLRMHSISRSADFIECWFPPRPEWWDTILRSLGFSNEIEPNNLRFCIGNITDNDVSERLKNYFYYGMGDSDLF